MGTYYTKTLRYLLLLLTVCINQHLEAQDGLSGFMQTQLVFDYKVATLYSHTNGIEFQNTYLQDDRSYWRVQQIDIYHFSQLKILDNQSIALGVQYRLENVFVPSIKDELRITEQYSHSRRGYLFRHGHRIRAEQRIKADEIIHRFRYRYMLDLPIKGTQLDVKEFYVAVALEPLLQIDNQSTPTYDQRLYLDIGTFFTKSLGLEFGLEYRLEDYTRQTEHFLFVNSALNISL